MTLSRTALMTPEQIRVAVAERLGEPITELTNDFALSLVKVLSKEGWFTTIQQHLNLTGAPWSCRFACVGRKRHFGTGQTLPEAICRAFLAVTSEVTATRNE